MLMNSHSSLSSGMMAIWKVLKFNPGCCFNMAHVTLETVEDTACSLEIFISHGFHLLFIWAETISSCPAFFVAHALWHTWHPP